MNSRIHDGLMFFGERFRWFFFYGVTGGSGSSWDIVVRGSDRVMFLWLLWVSNEWIRSFHLHSLEIKLNFKDKTMFRLMSLQHNFDLHTCDNFTETLLIPCSDIEENTYMTFL